MENQEDEIKEQPTLMGGLKGIGFAIIILGVAYYFYSAMTTYENGESVTMNRLLLLSYGLLGKNVTVGILGLFALIVGYGGAKEIIASKNSQ